LRKRNCAAPAAISWWRRQFSHVDRGRRKALQIAFGPAPAHATPADQHFMDLLSVHCVMMLSINAESKEGEELCGN
jgi:hypothetical protein